MPGSRGDALSVQQRKRASELVRASGRREPLTAIEPDDAPRDERAGEPVLVAANAPDGGTLLGRVDLARERVEFVRTPVRSQLSGRERRTAERVALADPRVIEFLDDRDARPLTRLWLGAEGRVPREGDRLAIVFLRPSSTERRYAIVDLGTKRLVDLVEPA